MEGQIGQADRECFTEGSVSNQLNGAIWKISTLTGFVLKHSLPKLRTKVFMNVHQHLSCETQ